MRWGVGTAQFGMAYGLPDQKRQLTKDEVRAVLRMAAGRFNVIDTAPGYGCSEERLGESVPKDATFSIVTKTPHWHVPRITPAEVARLKSVFEESLSRLRCSRVYGLLVHHAEDLIAEDGELLFAAMEELRAEGKVEKIGVSVYRADQIDTIMKRYPIDVVQLPFNVLDQRLLASGHLARLKEKGIEVHARSVFLQGVLLADPDTLPAHFRSLQDHLHEYGRFLAAAGLSKVEAALGFVSAVPEVDVALVGVTHPEHFQEILDASGTQLDRSVFRRFAVSEPAHLDPTMWRS